MSSVPFFVSNDYRDRDNIFFRHAKRGTSSCNVHDFSCVGHMGFNGLETTPEVYYNQKVNKCRVCGYEEVTFDLVKYNLIGNHSNFKYSVKEFGVRGVDCYLPFSPELGFGDVFSVLRFLPVLNKVGLSVGLILPSVFEKILPLLMRASYIKHVYLIQNCGVDDNLQLSAFINSFNLSDKILNLRIVISMVEYCAFNPIFSSDNFEESTDILLHRRKRNREVVLNTNRNFDQRVFNGIVKLLSSKYKVGIVGDLDRQGNNSKYDFRCLPFHEQLEAVGSTKLVISTDSVFDKVAEQMGVRSLICQIEGTAAYSRHVRDTKDFMVYVNQLGGIVPEMIDDIVGTIMSGKV